VLVAGAVRRMPQKKWICVGSVALMATTFVGMAAIWLVPGLAKSPSASFWYLLCYGLFFIFLGVNQLAQLTLQGKLLIATQRGRLLSISNGMGAVTSVACALLLLPLWLDKESGDFELLFLFTAALFACGAVVVTQLAEPADAAVTAKASRASSRWRFPGGRCDRTPPSAASRSSPCSMARRPCSFRTTRRWPSKSRSSISAA
jgi:hypothetical protein